MPRSKPATVNVIFGVDGEKVRAGLNLNAGTRAKIGRLARHRSYTITAFVEELVERAERRVTARLPSRAFKAYVSGKLKPRLTENQALCAAQLWQ
jgi:hypothetical protein